MGREGERGGLMLAGLQDLINLSQFPFDIIQTEMFSSLTELRHTDLQWPVSAKHIHNKAKNETTN